jgi:hypothetical protein
MANARSILPNFDVFTAPGVNVPPGTPTQAAAGAGALGKSRFFALSPVMAAVKGLGADDVAVPGVTVSAPSQRMGAGDIAWTMAILGVAGALCYQAGKAIAPSRQDATTWGWIGVPVGLFTGVLGLGVMGVVANQKKGG